MVWALLSQTAAICAIPTLRVSLFKELKLPNVFTLEASFCGAYPILPDRLCYREHFPDDEYFYSSEEELYNILSKKIKQWNPQKSYPSDDLVRYDWGNIIDKYDKLFESKSKD